MRDAPTGFPVLSKIDPSFIIIQKDGSYSIDLIIESSNLEK